MIREELFGCDFNRTYLCVLPRNRTFHHCIGSETRTLFTILTLITILIHILILTLALMTTNRAVFQPIIGKIMEKYQPGAIVLQCGADSLAGKSALLPLHSPPIPFSLPYLLFPSSLPYLLFPSPLLYLLFPSSLPYLLFPSSLPYLLFHSSLPYLLFPTLSFMCIELSGWSLSLQSSSHTQPYMFTCTLRTHMHILCYMHDSW